MHFTTEEQLKNCIALKNAERVYLIFGNESVLLTTYRKRLTAMLLNECGDNDIIDGKKLDLPAFYDAAQLLSMFGGRRLIQVDDFDVEALSTEDCKELCAFLNDLTDDISVVFCASLGSFDPKKGKNAKKFLAAADKNGVAAQLDRRSPADLKNLLRIRCKKHGCELSPPTASFLIERCGDDMGTLLNECEKLCAYADGADITEAMIYKVCSGALNADPFALARLMLRGELKAVLSQIDTLIRMRQPVMLLISNLGSAFCDLARACAARSEGKTAANLAEEFSYKFSWKAQNAFRDITHLDSARVFAVCEIFSEAEISAKSSPLDERILLETAVIRSMQALQGRVS